MQMQLRSEQLVINAIMTQPESIHGIMSKLTADMFHDMKNKLIFEVISSLYLERSPINLITIFKEAKQLNSIYKDEVAMEASRLQSAFTSVDRFSVPDAVDFLLAESVRNEHIDLGSKVKSLAESETYKPTDVINIIQEHITHNKYKSLANQKDFTNEQLLYELDNKMLNASMYQGISGIKTGYNRFDAVTSGMQPTNFIVVAARPGLGKTAWSLGVIRNASINDGKKGLFISCEMDEVQVMKRIIAMDAGIKGHSIKVGQLIPSERKRFERSRERIAKAPFKIVAGSFTISDIVSLVYKMKNAEGLDYVVIDYIQKVQAPKAQNRTNEVGEVSRRLKDMANDLKIPIIGLAQLSRAVEHRVDKKPMLSDLRESGDIEQDADIVAFLYRPSYYMDDEERVTSPMAKDGYIIIAKHRDGEIEDIQLKFETEIPAWMNPMDKIYEEEVYTQTAITPNTDFDEVPF